jgi:lipoprotein-anchoring transpeptidase ErfK/SrfK
MARLAAIAFVAAAFLPGTALAAVPESHEGAQIMRQVFVKAAPAAHSRRVGYLPTYTPYTGRALVVPVLAHRNDRNGNAWIKVRLYKRPNGSTGWIPKWITRKRKLEWTIDVSRAKRTVSIYRGGQLVRKRRVVVGRSGRPTPGGRFFVVDRVRLYNAWASGIWALPISGLSNAVKRFDGGDGRVAMHGRGSLGDPLGTASSNGCIRLNDLDIAWLAKRIPVGTPVRVR